MIKRKLEFLISISASATINIWHVIVPLPPVVLRISSFTPSRVSLKARPNP